MEAKEVNGSTIRGHLGGNAKCIWNILVERELMLRIVDFGIVLIDDLKIMEVKSEKNNVLN